MIDDDEDDVEILTDALMQSGVNEMHQVKTAMEAFIYLESVESDCLPKLIIADHFLPGISGKEFFADLKKMDKYKHIPLVVLSTTKPESEMEDYRKLGILEYVIKPSSYEDYVQVAATLKNKINI